MVSIVSPMCKCGQSRPHFGFVDDKKPSCCSQCKLDGMVAIVRRKCNCGDKSASFGFVDDIKPSCCNNCKPDGMINIVSPKCKCGKSRPYFGFLSDSKPSCCSKCKLEGMEDIVSRKCKCGKALPYFGFANDSRPTCCRQCKQTGMIDIRSRRCQKCSKQAGYPDAAGRPRQLCAAHSAEVGAHVLSSNSRSRVASKLFDALENELGCKFPFRFRWDPTTSTWYGQESIGLVSNRNLQPDAFDPKKGKVVEFLGNFYHGYPPNHPQYGSFTCVGGRSASELYAETMARLDLFLAEGLHVFYIWEHDFKEWQKEAASSTIQST
ncbi:unnamed protein product, partial [Effrenium voratum]